MNITKEYKETVRLFIKNNRLNVLKISEEAGINQSYLSRWIGGSPVSDRCFAKVPSYLTKMHKELGVLLNKV